MSKIQYSISQVQSFLALNGSNKQLLDAIRTVTPRLFVDSAEYAFLNGSFFHWCGTHWQETQTEVIPRIVTGLIGSLSAAGVTGIEAPALYKDLCYLIERKLDIEIPRRNVGFMNFKNGTLELSPLMKTPILRAHDKSDYITDCLDFDFVTDAKDARLDELFSFALPSLDDQTLLLQFFLSGFLPKRPQGIQFLVGASGTSKGTMFEIFKSVLGDAMVFKTIDSLGSQFERFDVVGKRLAVVSDATFSKKDSKNQVAILRDYSDNIPIDFNRKYKQPLQTTDYPAIIVAMNPYNVPASTFESEFARRISYIRMDNKAIQGQYGFIPDLTNVIQTDAFRQAFICRAIAELRAWNGKAYSKTETHKRDAKTLTSQADSVAEFLSDYVADTERKHQKLYVPAKTVIYDKHYTEFCNDHGYTPRLYSEFKEIARSQGLGLPEKINGAMCFKMITRTNAAMVGKTLNDTI